MASAFANISFTEDVKHIQTEMGSRNTYQQFELGEQEPVVLSEFEASFIEQRDSFYQATVSSNGWPYVQHRGGDKGFLKVLDEKTIGYADFTGNRQYISVGNLSGDQRISLILMDYQHQQRLKIWGIATLVKETDDPDLIAQLETENSRAPVERGVVIHVVAFDWNCPKHITPRLTHAEWEQLLVKQQYSKAESNPELTSSYSGNGTIAIQISAVELVADGIRMYRLSSKTDTPLPDFQPGAHIKVPVAINAMNQTVRAYSLIHFDQTSNDYYIAVKKDENGQGGSMAIHRDWQVGTELNIERPENYFQLNPNSPYSILIAGGIGITALLSMAYQLKHQEQPFELHYTSKTQRDMAFLEQLSRTMKPHCHFYFSEQDGDKLDIRHILTSAPNDTIFYVCGPSSLVNDTLAIADTLDASLRQRINVESFQ
jgi:hypothetical protein